MGANELLAQYLLRVSGGVSGKLGGSEAPEGTRHQDGLGMSSLEKIQTHFQRQPQTQRDGLTDVAISGRTSTLEGTQMLVEQLTRAFSQKRQKRSPVKPESVGFGRLGGGPCGHGFR
jgi:hypothetical protein